MTTPSEAPDSIALIFTETYHAELQRQRAMIDSLEHPIGRQVYQAIAAEAGVSFEKMSRAEMESNMQPIAIALGVAAALRVALGIQGRESAGT